MIFANISHYTPEFPHGRTLSVERAFHVSAILSEFRKPFWPGGLRIYANANAPDLTSKPRTDRSRFLRELMSRKSESYLSYFLKQLSPISFLRPIGDILYYGTGYLRGGFNGSSCSFRFRILLRFHHKQSNLTGRCFTNRFTG